MNHFVVSGLLNQVVFYFGNMFGRCAAAAADDARSKVEPVSRALEILGRRVLVGKQPLGRVEAADVSESARGCGTVRRQLAKAGGDLIGRSAVKKDNVRLQRLEGGDGLRKRFPAKKFSVLIAYKSDPCGEAARAHDFECNLGFRDAV